MTNSPDEKIDAPAFVRDLANAHKTTAATNGNKIVIEIEDEVGTLEADQLALNKILDNLLTNACKFTKDGTVTIAAAHRHVDGRPWIEFAVNDEGEGTSPDEQAKAFTPFVYRKTGNESGNGLGLVICKELTEQMGGRIGFVSEVGKGTRFTILLPVEASGDRGYETSSGEPQSLPAARSRRGRKNPPFQCNPSKGLRFSLSTMTTPPASYWRGSESRS